MQLARFLNNVFKKDGFILIDANSKSYIIGNPKSENPIKLKILNKNLHYKLLFHPDLYFGEAYTDGDIVIENGTLTDFLDLALSENPKSAQPLTHPDFTFTFMGETEISNIAFDREAYFDDWIPNVVGALLPNGITLTTTDMIGDENGVAVIMEGDAEGINGEYDNKYVFVYKFKDGKILSINEYNSDLLVATRLYKNKLVPLD